MKIVGKLEHMIATLREPAPKARSLILTAWGDTVFAFGGRAWLGSLVPLMAPLGLDERLVRTSVQRLVADGWLETQAHGKKRDVVMAQERVFETQSVQKKIYCINPPEWDEQWHLLIANPSSAAKRESLRRELSWLGYAGLSPNLYIHPHDRWSMAQTRLAAKGLTGQISHRFKASSQMATPPLVELWPLEEFRSTWQDLALVFEGLSAEVSHRLPDDQTCFLLRTLAVHAVRRTVLRDPALPMRHLPEDWPAQRARSAFCQLWKRLRVPADRFSAGTLEMSKGDVEHVPEEYEPRFAD